MNLKQALKRIEELEARVRKLEAEPKEIHYHTHQAPYVPACPAPQNDPLQPPWITTWCGPQSFGGCSTTTGLAAGAVSGSTFRLTGNELMTPTGH